MLKSVSKKLSAVLAVSAIATMLVPSSSNAMEEWGEKTNKPSSNSSATQQPQQELLTGLLDISEFAARISYNNFHGTRDAFIRWVADWRAADISAFSAEDLLGVPVLVLTGHVCEHGLGAIPRLDLGKFDRESKRALLSAAAWHTNNADDVSGAIKASIRAEVHTDNELKSTYNGIADVLGSHHVD